MLSNILPENIFITADHGFLYQQRALDDTDFSVADPEGEGILFRNRRFIIGRNLSDTSGMKKFSSAQLGLAGDLDVLISNSINRLRIKGAGSRFVHGGASLQEIVIPVLRVGKQREVDIKQVEVQIIVSGRSLLSSGQTAAFRCGPQRSGTALGLSGGPRPSRHPRQGP